MTCFIKNSTYSVVSTLPSEHLFKDMIGLPRNRIEDLKPLKYNSFLEYPLWKGVLKSQSLKNLLVALRLSFF